MRIYRSVACCLIFLTATALSVNVCARSAFSPRHSGMEAPGGPRQLESMPMLGPSRTPEGGMGYTDAYGRTLTDKMPEERKPRQRPRYGGYAKKEPVAELPNVDPVGQRPVWSFR